jgi:hypothetical protein
MKTDHQTTPVNKFSLAFFAVIGIALLASCVSQETQRSSREDYFDKLFGGDTRAQRDNYIASHPDLDPADKQSISNRVMSIYDAEYRRTKKSKDAEDSAARVKMDEIRTARAEEQAKQEEAERQAAIDNLPGASPRIRMAMINKQILVGMTAEQVKLAWGKPRHVSATSTATSTFETWSYNSETFLQFTDGILQSFTTSR